MKKEYIREGKDQEKYKIKEDRKNKGWRTDRFKGRVDKD